ncbi:MAG: DUF1847 domain-containing protein [Anaerolineales bacterium]|nr:DUF1847 domain-containing protein [Anaerolineales bacterium]
MDLKCAKCKVQVCLEEPGSKSPPIYCAMASDDEEIVKALQEAAGHYIQEGADRKIALEAARTEAAGYLRWPRVQEVMDFAWRIGAKHLGIAHCIGLIEEAHILQKILEANDFQVSSICCKVGCIPKTGVGLTQQETLAPEGGFDPLCNPVGQASLLNLAATDLNILVGLCVGHDTLFLKYSQAPATVLVTKDRVTGHNPVAALYTYDSYYKRLARIKVDKQE